MPLKLWEAALNDNPRVVRALSRLADEIEPERSEAVDFAPPSIRRAADYDVDMRKLADDIASDPKDDLAERLLTLSYGDMMDVCAGIIGQIADNSAVTTKEDMAAVFHKWAKSEKCRKHL